MYLDPNKCAECGGKFDDTYRVMPYNTDLDKYASEPRPYFCSDKCADGAVGRKQIISKYDSEYEDARRDVYSSARELDDGLTQANEDMLFETLNSSLQRAKERLRDGPRTEIDTGYRNYFKLFKEQAVAKINAANAADSDSPALFKTPYHMSLTIDAIKRVAGTDPTPQFFLDMIAIALPVINKVNRKGSYYAREPEKDFATLIRLCVKALGKIPTSTDAGALEIGYITVLEAAPDPVRLVRAICRIFATTFDGHESILRYNLRKMLGKPHTVTDDELWKHVTPEDVHDFSWRMRLFDNTAGLDSLLNAGFTISVPQSIRFEHTHVLAGSGAGKTTLLTQQFLRDIDSPDQPAIIIIDGKGAWAPNLQRFAVFAPQQKHHDRVRIINPQDTSKPAALNMFALPDVPQDLKRSMLDSVSENLAYIFGSREFELSAKQRTAFTYAAQLVFTMHEPTIETLLALMQDPVEKSGGVPASSMFRAAVDRLPNIQRRFMNELFYHPTEFLETKRQIQNRIYDLLSCPAFEGMFTQAENRLDIFDIMQSGKILIVDASPGAVGEKAAASFGRYIISMALSTARARITIPRSQWRPTFLYIDEAQLFVDEERTQPLLQQAREFNLGVILSHQKIMDLTPELWATFAGNTSTKYCAYPSSDDARDMAKEMGCKPEFIKAQRKDVDTTQFATYVRGFTESAVSYRIPLGTMHNTPKMSDEAYATMIARNRELMSAPSPVSRPAPAAPQPTRAPPLESAPPPSKSKGGW